MSLRSSNVAAALVVCVSLCLLVDLAGASQLPIVLWHGMGDTCCNPLSIGGLVDAIKSRYGAALNTPGELSRSLSVTTLRTPHD